MATNQNEQTNLMKEFWLEQQRKVTNRSAVTDTNKVLGAPKQEEEKTFVMTMKLRENNKEYFYKLYDLTFSIIQGDIETEYSLGVPGDEWKIVRNTRDFAETCCEPELNKMYQLKLTTYKGKPSFLVETIHPQSDKTIYNGNLDGWGDEVYIHNGYLLSHWAGCWGITRHKVSKNKELTIKKEDGSTLTDTFAIVLNTPNQPDIDYLINQVESVLGKNWDKNPLKSFKIIYRQ